MESFACKVHVRIGDIFCASENSLLPIKGTEQATKVANERSYVSRNIWVTQDPPKSPDSNTQRLRSKIGGDLAERH